MVSLSTEKPYWSRLNYRTDSKGLRAVASLHGAGVPCFTGMQGAPEANIGGTPAIGDSP